MKYKKYLAQQLSKPKSTKILSSALNVQLNSSKETLD